jgi:putative peptidoglycan lipid II flippase
VTLGLGLISLNLSVDALFATLVSEEAPRAIDAAFRIYLLPQGIFSVAVATVLFPTIARQAAHADLDGMRATIARGVRTIAFMLVPASAFLLVLAEPTVRLIFERGHFDAMSTTLTSKALVFFCIGLTFNGASLLLIRVFFALQSAWLPTKVALLGVGLNAACDAALYRPLGVGGIPLSTSISSAVTCVVLIWLLDRRLDGLHLAWILDGVARILVASAVSALLAWTVWKMLDEGLGRAAPDQAVAMGAAVAAATLAYLAAARIASMNELSAFSTLLRRRR